MSDQNRTTNPLAGEVFEVFARRKPEDPLHHIGYVNAPDAELAGVYARSSYAEWATGAPSLEAATAAAAMAQAELGHARALLPLLREFPVVSSVMADEDRPPERCARLLDAPFA